MSSTKVKLNLAGFRELRTNTAAQELVRSHAERIKAEADRAVDSAAGEPHVVKVDQGRTRARAVVITATAEAMLAEAQDRNLTRAVSAGRG